MKVKVCIGMPTAGVVKTKTMFALIRMLKHSKIDYNIVTKEGCVLHWNREHIVKQAIEGKCSHILFIDSDMFFEADAMERLLKRKKDIIGIASHLRTLPLTSTVKINAENGVIIKKEYPNGLLKCAGVATGFMLIKTSVFKKLSEPWFFWESNNKGEVVTGEDMWFCRKAREAGYDIWCDTTLKVGHIGDYIF